MGFGRDSKYESKYFLIDKGRLVSPKSFSWIYFVVAICGLLTLGVYVGSQYFLPTIKFLPDQGASWYYWKLPEPTFASRASVWILYGLHQLGFWFLVLRMARRSPKVWGALTRDNWNLIAYNLLFVGLHALQSYIWYDGLAQDTSIWLSQYSVALILIWVLLMENSRRGLVWGRRIPFPPEVDRIAKSCHGVVFAWGTTWTFWFHPFEGTSGHLVGFFYMFLLFAQGSLVFTQYHLDTRWRFFLEVFVLFHATTVAYLQNPELLPMFFMGFLTIAVLTQMHGLKLTGSVKWGAFVFWLALVVLNCLDFGWQILKVLIRIPVAEFLGVLILGGIFLLYLKLTGGLTRNSPMTSQS